MAEREALAGGAFEDEGAGVGRAMVCAAEAHELIGVVGPAFAPRGDVVKIEETVVLAAGDDAALVLSLIHI